MSAAENIYAFELIFPDAVKAVMTAREIKAFCLSDKPDLKRDRPRVEIVFFPGQGQGQWKLIEVDGVQQPVETSWKGQFELTLVTPANVDLHMAYIAEIRAVMHSISAYINSVAPMTRHKIQPFFHDAGTQSDWQPRNNEYLSRLNFEVDYSVQDDAWEELFG